MKLCCSPRRAVLRRQAQAQIDASLTVVPDINPETEFIPKDLVTYIHKVFLISLIMRIILSPVPYPKGPRKTYVCPLVDWDQPL